MERRDVCQNCGSELTDENKYMDGMCMECKCGINWREESLGISVSEGDISLTKTNPYLLIGLLITKHEICEDIFSNIGSIVDDIMKQVKVSENIDDYIKDTSCLKDIYNKLNTLEFSIKDYKDSVNKFIQDANRFSER